MYKGSVYNEKLLVSERARLKEDITRLKEDVKTALRQIEYNYNKLVYIYEVELSKFEQNSRSH